VLPILTALKGGVLDPTANKKSSFFQKKLNLVLYYDTTISLKMIGGALPHKKSYPKGTMPQNKNLTQINPADFTNCSALP
jgi:hypothetical protein